MADCISILMYHRIGDFHDVREHRALFCRYRRFNAQMRWLKYMKYNVIDMDTCIRAVRREIPIPSRAVVLTFDDGFEDFYIYAFPVLKRYKFPAVVYVLPNYINGTADWFAKEGRPCPPMLKLEQIQEIMDYGIEIGSHGLSHVKLAEVSYERMRKEIFESKIEIEAIIKRKVRHFCYPYGSYNTSVIEVVKEAGYVSAVTCVRGGVVPGNDLWQLPRKAVSFGDSLLGFWWKLHMKHKRKEPEMIRIL